MSVINRNSGSPIFNTLAEAVASNMGIGQLPIVLGDSAAFDKGGIIYSVQANGSGGLAMSNGNELVQYTGTAAVEDIQTSSTDTTAGALMAVGAFGLGLGQALSFTDVDTLRVPAVYGMSSAAPNLPEANTGVLSVSSMSVSSDNDRLTQTYTVLINNRVYVRSDNGSGFGTWQELYHTGNLNQFEFGGDVSGDDIAVGFAESATVAQFTLPISLFSPPTSITVTSTFAVLEALSGSTTTTLTPVISSRSSNKLLRLQITGLSGMTAGDQLLLRQDTASSKITVNS